MRSILVRFIVLLAVAAVAGMGYFLMKRLPERKQEVPVVQVKRGDLMVRTYVRGELRAIRSTLLTTPNLGGSAQITRLAPNGAMAQVKNLIVEFDDSDLLASLEDAELEVSQVGENIKKAEADLHIRRNQDQVDLLKARYAVRRAELEVRRNELISAIDARKNILTLEEAKRALTKLEEDIKSRLQEGEAELAVLREQQRKAKLEVNRVKSRMDQTKILAPMTGLVSIKENRSGSFFFGQQLPDIREGDQLPSGMPIAEILDLSELEVAARVNETERASLHEGQDVVVRLDALPGKVVHSKIKTLGGTASSNIFSSDPVKRFDCVFAVEMREMLAQIGANPAQINRILATAAENAKRFQTSAEAPHEPIMPPEGSPMMVAAVRPGAGPVRKAEGPGEAAPIRRPFGGRPGAGPAAEGPGGGGPPGNGSPDIASLSLRQAIAQKFTAEERENAELPAPPEENSVMDVLLRPGLLVESEIIIEKIPNTLYIPQQAVFEKGGKNVVFAWAGNRFEQRTVKLGKRTESQVAILEGLREGERVALADMESGRAPSKKDKGPAPRAQPALPGPQASLPASGSRGGSL